MLGTAGTIAAEIFVLTGHAASRSGPAAVLAILIGGLLSYSIALNYAELATTYPVTGGAMTYVREAWGTNFLSFVVGSLDCLSSTFYAALSAVGFSYSLRVLIPGVPIVPTSIVVALAFISLNVLGVGFVGSVQVLLGGFLLTALGVYVVGGLVLPNGFSWQTLLGDGLFIYPTLPANALALLSTIALIYNAYVGFEVLADDAEEMRDPSRNLPRAILLSLTIVTVIYVLVALVTLGSRPWQEIADSETALTDAIVQFLPGVGAPMLALAGIVATLTSVNSAMLSATREALTLSRDGLWPRFMSRLSSRRTPHLAVLVVGGMVIAITLIGAVDFLSYISSAGYLFVLFFSNLAMIRLRQRYPDIERPFKVPAFPLTAYLASGTCLVIIASAETRPLLFLLGLIGLLATFYYLYRPAEVLIGRRLQALERRRDQILVSALNPATVERLVRVATALWEASEDASIRVVSVIPFSRRGHERLMERYVERVRENQRQVLQKVVREAERAGVPLYTRIHMAPSVAQGILDEVRGNVKLVLMGWPGPSDVQQAMENHVKTVLEKAPAHVAVLAGAEPEQVKRILVPVGGGPHSRLALRLACEIAEHEDAEVTALQCYCEEYETEDLEDRLLALREVIEEELGDMPARVKARVAYTNSLVGCIMAEVQRVKHDLIIVGAAEWVSPEELFGSVTDRIAEQAPAAVLLVRRHEPAAISWVRRHVKAHAPGPGMPV